MPILGVATLVSNDDVIIWLYAGNSVVSGGTLNLMAESENLSSADNQQERLLEISSDYIVGLVDGEGYFSTSPRIRIIGNKEVIEVDCVFGIDLKEEDRPILERLQQHFGCGKLYFRRDSRKNFCNLWAYRVRTHKDLIEKIIPFFRANALQFPSKQRSFKNFERILRIVERQEHQTTNGFNRIKGLVLANRILRDYTPNSS